MDRLLQDLRTAVRSLARRRTFTVVAVLTLATGIGATTAIFSIVDAVLLRPLPYRDPGHLFRVWQAFPEWRTSETLGARWDRVGLSYPQYVAIRDLRDLVDSAAAYLPGGSANLTAGGTTDKARVARTSATLLSTLGLGPLFGRDFSATDEEGEGRAVVLLGYEAWRRRFGGDPAVLGRSIRLDGQPFVVAGVMPPELRLLGRMRDGSYVPPDVWLPVGTGTSFASGNFGHGYQAVVRLRAGVDPRAAQSAIVPLLGRVMATYRPTARTPGGSLEPLGRDETLGARTALWILLAAAAVVLLVACGNVANLMLSEVGPRSRELAVRATLGADRLRLVRMLLTESLVVAAVAGALGFAVAAWSLDALVALAPPGTPNIDAARLDARVFAFSLLLTAGTGVLFGLVPAWLAVRADVVAGLKESRPTPDHAGGRLQRVVCAAEVAVAVVVLVGGGLLVQSLVRLHEVDPGFDAKNLLTFGIDLPDARYSEPAARRTFFDDLRGRVSALPGVRAVTQTTSLPFLPPPITSNPISVVGRPATEQLETERRYVVPNFFDVVGVRIIEGTGLPDDTGNGGCRVLVSGATVRRLWPDGGAVGARINFWDRTCMVAGIAADIKERSLGAEPLPTLYAISHGGDGGSASLMVRTDVAPESLIPAVRRIVAAMDPEVPVLEPASMDTLIDRTLAMERYRTIPMALFALATVLLAAVGIYGLMAQVVSRETRALGIRLALGARPVQVITGVLGHAVAIAGAGLLAGIAGALAASRLVRAFLFDVAPTDPWTYASVAVAVLLLMALAGWIPALRTTRLDPAAVLRVE